MPCFPPSTLFFAPGSSVSILTKVFFDQQKYDCQCQKVISGGRRNNNLSALEQARKIPDRPHAIVLDTLMGKGVSAFESREKNHFIRVEPGEWSTARRQLEEAPL